MPTAALSLKHQFYTAGVLIKPFEIMLMIPTIHSQFIVFLLTYRCLARPFNLRYGTIDTLSSAAWLSAPLQASLGFCSSKDMQEMQKNALKPRAVVKTFIMLFYIITEMCKAMYSDLMTYYTQSNAQSVWPKVPDQNRSTR